ncbi:very short patch repair endonuclease [Nocardia tengchongensis]
MPDQRGKHWNRETPPDRAYKRQKRAAAPTIEQDLAAGGRHRRFVALSGGGLARASVSLRLYRRTRRIRAYLRWSECGVTKERYVCEVHQKTRRQNLEEAWQQARELGFVTEASLPADSKASSIGARAVMRANRGKDTAPEMALRKLLYQRALRYRVNARPLSNLKRSADVVFPRDRVAVFVDGCFWHGCPEHYRPSAKNAEFWEEKIEANRARDLDTNRALVDAGWVVVRVWEHEDAAASADRIANLLEARRRDQNLRVAESVAHQ